MNSLKSILNRAASYVQPVIDNAKANMPNGVTATRVIAVTAAVALAAYVAKRALCHKDTAEASASPSITGRVKRFCERIRSAVADFARRIFSGKPVDSNGDEPVPSAEPNADKTVDSPEDQSKPVYSTGEEVAGNEPVPSTDVEEDETSDSSSESGSDGVDPDSAQLKLHDEPAPTATPVEETAPVAQDGKQSIQLVISGAVPAALVEHLKSAEGIQIVASGGAAFEMNCDGDELKVGGTSVARKSESVGYMEKEEGVLHLRDFTDPKNFPAIARAIANKFGPKK